MDQKTIREILEQYIEDPTLLDESEALITEWSISHGPSMDIFSPLTSAGRLEQATATRIRDILDRVSEAEHDPSQLLDNRYLLTEQLGQGGQGMVYRARDLYLDRDVAIKRLTRLGDSGTQRMLQEVRSLYSVRHPSIVREFGFGIARGTEEPYLVLEYLAGLTLTGWINTRQGNRIHPPEALDALCPVVEAIGLLHESGIIHRDLKPSNIMMATREGEQQQRAFLIDLGGAHVKNSGLTQTGEVIGTVRYMAPEQALSREITPATDTYGIGGVLYRLLTGFPPHHGNNYNECVTQLLKGQIIAPRRRVPDLDRGMEEILLKFLALDPAERYPNGSALHAELERYRQGISLTVRLPGPARRLTRWLATLRQDRTALLLMASCLLCVVLALSARAFDRHLDRTAAQVAFHAEHGKTTERITALFESARSCLRGLGREASRAQVALDRGPFRSADSGQDALAQRLLELLGDWPKFSWISYSSRAGDFIGAYRVPGHQALWLNKSYLTADGKTEVHQLKATNSTVTPTADPPLKSGEGYDPRTRPFYKLAISKPGIHWTEPYPFWEGFPGITCTTSVLGPQGKVRGVLTVDLETWPLGTTLSSSKTHTVVLFTENNQVVALSPVGIIGSSQKLIAGSASDARLVTIDEIAAPLIQAFASALGTDRSARELNFEHQEKQYHASLRTTDAGGLPLRVGIILPANPEPRHTLLRQVGWIGWALAAICGGLLLLRQLWGNRLE